ncbi:Aspartate aminotransferase, cytoplasmic [Salvia divinorum]|uniref:Aspartate aminotransferase, cytoplasmic n=1 Tax=Salvia divinorum TaxID=28513 RepID=A0ABD1FLH3_SALDI
MISDIKVAPEGSFVLRHGCAHNPTGIDLTPEQWEVIADIIQKKKHIPFFDVAYQGFPSGSLDKDASSVRLFAAHGTEVLVAQSYSKNLGLYSERIGAINVVCSSSEVAQSITEKEKTSKDWSFILEQIGMFSFTGLNKAQSENMTSKWHIYMTKDGRISLAGLSAAECDYLADAIIDSYHNVS